jgi:membrane-associated phospholipid phosphatase
LQQALADQLQNFDYNIFNKINHEWANSFFDVVMPFLRESVVWTPLYLFLIAFAYINFGKNGLFWILGAIVTVVISNFISSDIIKVITDKPRPCRDSMLEPGARLLVNRCPGHSSFTSSHATNHFAVAMFIYITFRHFVNWSIWFFIWAFAICYAQVYVGVHFPIDVIGGAILGCSIGYTTSTFFNFKLGMLKLPIQS